MIIDSGSSTNIVSTLLVEKLRLPTIKHPNPYRLQWLSDRGEVKVISQAKLTFTIGKYSEEVTCHVVPMEAGHLLLGRPWEYDRGAIHDGKSNKYSFTFKNRKITFLPTTPAQVYECQVQLKVEFDRKKLAAQSRDEPKTDALVRKPVPNVSEEIEEITRRSASKGKNKMALFAGVRDVQCQIQSNGILVLLIFQESYFSNTDLPSNLPVETLYCRIFLMSFPRSYLMDCHHHEKLNIKLTSYLEP
ncbi:hypothetical protein BRCH_02722c [Candidatus Burkholderia brachyanthoides]|nr:hypothetical protein BRCH_02722c [Candidatus Burkholderia brachyanthoides]